MIGVAGIILSLLLLIWLAYRDVSVLILAAVCAMLAVLLDGSLPILATYTQIFMASVGQFVANYFPLFLLGALFGKLMEDTGCAAKIASVIVRVVGVDRMFHLFCGVRRSGLHPGKTPETHHPGTGHRLVADRHPTISLARHHPGGARA